MTASGVRIVEQCFFRNRIPDRFGLPTGSRFHFILTIYFDEFQIKNFVMNTLVRNILLILLTNYACFVYIFYSLLKLTSFVKYFSPTNQLCMFCLYILQLTSDAAVAIEYWTPARAFFYIATHCAIRTVFLQFVTSLRNVDFWNYTNGISWAMYMLKHLNEFQSF